LAKRNPPYDFCTTDLDWSEFITTPASAGTFLPVRGYVSGDGIHARSGTVPTKAMRCNARVAFVLCGSLNEEPTA
jgi:hypothetical protein